MEEAVLQVRAPVQHTGTGEASLSFSQTERILFIERIQTELPAQAFLSVKYLKFRWKD